MVKTEHLNAVPEVHKVEQELATTDQAGPPATTSITARPVDEDDVTTAEQVVPKLGTWVVVGAAAIGRSHVERGTPCQDAYTVRRLDDGWGVAVVCDGAGSQPLSHVGARFVAERAAERFCTVIAKRAWQRMLTLPSESEWERIARGIFFLLRQDLDDLATQRSIAPEALACTAIVVVYSPIGLLVAHIGDGRAGFCSAENGWHALMSPFKGEEANMTTFLTSPSTWARYRESIESRVFVERPTAFTLMTDGCEMHAFECGIFDETQQRYIRLNRPFAGFFDPVAATLEQLYRDGASAEEIATRWRRLLEQGTAGLRTEPDDKTMVLGVYVEDGNVDYSNHPERP